MIVVFQWCTCSAVVSCVHSSISSADGKNAASPADMYRDNTLVYISPKIQQLHRLYDFSLRNYSSRIQALVESSELDDRVQVSSGIVRDMKCINANIDVYLLVIDK